jgi:hypothetical protein
VSQILFIFGAEGLDQVGVGEQELGEFDGDRLSEGFGIVEDELEIQMAEVAAVKTLGDPQGVTVLMAPCVQPAAVVQSDGLDHQRIAFPPADRRTQPGRLRVFRVLSPIREDLPESRMKAVKVSGEEGRVRRGSSPGLKSAKMLIKYLVGISSPRPLAPPGSNRISSGMGEASGCQIPERSGLPLEVRGAGADRFGLPSLGSRSAGNGVMQPLSFGGDRQ